MMHLDLRSNQIEQLPMDPYWMRMPSICALLLDDNPLSVFSIAIGPGARSLTHALHSRREELKDKAGPAAVARDEAF